MSATINKIGLALSGGGFRASLYHLNCMTNDEKRELFQDLLAKHSRVYADARGGIVQVHSMPWNSD
jgi:hypothetical protein